MPSASRRTRHLASRGRVSPAAPSGPSIRARGRGAGGAGTTGRSTARPPVRAGRGCPRSVTRLGAGLERAGALRAVWKAPHNAVGGASGSTVGVHAGHVSASLSGSCCNVCCKERPRRVRNAENRPLGAVLRERMTRFELVTLRHTAFQRIATPARDRSQPPQRCGSRTRHPSPTNPNLRE
jgi:hypothetical protein